MEKEIEKIEEQIVRLQEAGRQSQKGIELFYDLLLSTDDVNDARRLGANTKMLLGRWYNDFNRQIDLLVEKVELEKGRKNDIKEDSGF